jgi:hypothetical protein
MILKLTEKVQELCKDNEFLKCSMSKIAAAVSISSVQTSISAHCGPLISAAVTDVPTHRATSAMPTIPTSAESGVKSYRDVASAGSRRKEFPAAGRSQC